MGSQMEGAEIKKGLKPRRKKVRLASRPVKAI